MFKIVAYYTINTPYVQEALELAKTLEIFNLDYIIKGVKNQGSWVRNCAYKATFMLDMMNQLKCRLMYLDVDARVRRYPILMDTFEHDVGFFYRRRRELVSATMIFNYNDRVIKLLQLWQQAQLNRLDEFDQRVLQRVVETYKDDLKLNILKFSSEYAQIFDAEKDNDETTVIEQFQASRRFRKIINANTRKV
jgi:hypothetical protein